MKYTKQFIEDAIEGGCILPESFTRNVTETVAGLVLLDPTAWKAVGKTRGWRVVGDTKKDNDHNPDSYYNMQKFVALLHDGKTIEQALEAIS